MIFQLGLLRGQLQNLQHGDDTSYQVTQVCWALLVVSIFDFFNGPPQRSRKHRSIPPRPPFHRTSHRSLTAWYIVTCDKANLGSMVIHDSRCPACPKDSRGTNQAISRGVSVHIYHIDGGWIHVFLICCRVATHGLLVIWGSCYARNHFSKVVLASPSNTLGISHGPHVG